MNGEQLIEALKQKCGVRFDSELAKRLGVSRQAISTIRKEKMGVSDSMALKMSEILEIPPHVIHAYSAAWMCISEKEKQKWLKAVVGIVLAITVGTHMHETVTNVKPELTALYIMRSSVIALLFSALLTGRFLRDQQEKRSD